MLFFNGRITGISGILGRSLSAPKSENTWQYTFLLGLILGGVILLNLYPQFFEFEINFSYTEAIIAGLLVGFGTRLGNGCTSGHGVCGLANLSIRSLTATLNFMAAGIVTVFLKGLI